MFKIMMLFALITVIKNHCLTILTYLLTYQILNMNELTDIRELPPNEDMKYQLRFITIHEGQGGGFQGNEDGTEDEEAPQAHYFGYLCNFATSQWYQLDDDDVEEVEEKIVLEDAKDKAYMLHYICCGSEEFNACYQEDKSLCSYPKTTPVAVTATSTPKSSATPSADRPPETSQKDDSKGLMSKGKDLLMNRELPEKTVAAATHTPDAIHSAHPKCSWSISSMGCILPTLEPKDKCGIEGCQLVSHHMCQTEWESYQYRLECPNGDPSLSKYDSGGKKRCIHHHPHSKLVIPAVLPSTVEIPVLNSSTTTVVALKGSVSQSTQVDGTIAGKESDAKDTDIHLVADQKELTVLKTPTTKDLYLQAIQEMYPGINTGRLSSNLTYFENWTQVRATAAFKAFTTVKKMITEKKIVYDNRSSLSDDESSAGSSESSPAGCVQWRPKKVNLDEDDKKFFTSLPTCYALFFAFDSKDASESYCPFAKYNEGWQKMNSLEPILSWYTCRNRSFKADELRQHVRQAHSKSWCGMGVKLFLHELYPSPLTGDKQSTSNQGQKKKIKSKTTHYQYLSKINILLTHILKQNHCRICNFTDIHSLLLDSKE